MTGASMRARLALAAAFLLGGCGDPPAKKSSQEPRAAVVTQIDYKRRETKRSFSALIRPRVENDQGFRIGGKVLARFVNVGARVSAGTSLAALDKSDLQLQLDQAQAEVNAAAAANEQASSDERRAHTLLREGWTTRASYDRYRTGAEEAHSRLLRARRGLELASNAMSYATLKAEYEGVVTAALVEPGQVVALGQPAFRIAGTGETEAVVSVPENDLDLVKRGQAELSLWASPQQKYRAVLRELSPVAEGQGRTFSARFSLPDAGAALAFGMSATLFVTRAEDLDLACIPLTALFNDGEGPSVFVVKEDGALRRMLVSVERYEFDAACLAGGAPAGATIIASGVQSLDENLRVQVVQQLGR
jgi:RND family efflux transporter MFP subunit